MFHKSIFAQAFCILTALRCVLTSTFKNSTSSNDLLFVLLGETGVGKSSLINMLRDGNEAAPVGHKYDAETIDSRIYNTNISINCDDRNYKLQLMDTPGWLDSSGYTNEEIETLIGVTMFDNGIKDISGLLLVIDGSQTRVAIKQQFAAMEQIFDNQTMTDLLKNTIIVFTNRDHSWMTETSITNLKAYTNEQLSIIAQENNISLSSINIDSKIVLVDSKTNVLKYKKLLIDNIEKNLRFTLNCNSSIDARPWSETQELLDDAMSEYKQELKQRTVRHQMVVKETYDCNCRKQCKRTLDFLGIKKCVKKYHVCDKCVRERIETVPVQENYVEKKSFQQIKAQMRDEIVKQIKEDVKKAKKQRQQKSSNDSSTKDEL